MAVKKANLALNLGPKSTKAMASVGVKTLAQLTELGWEEAFRRLVALHPEFINLNMATALIGAVDGRDWRKVSAFKKMAAKELIKSLKVQLAEEASLKSGKKSQRKSKTSAKKVVDHSFVEFVVEDLLSAVAVDSRRMFGCVALYVNNQIFGIISESHLYLRTDETSRQWFIDEGLQPFKASAKITLKSYYEAPPAFLENGKKLTSWLREHFEV